MNKQEATSVSIAHRSASAISPLRSSHSICAMPCGFSNITDYTHSQTCSSHHHYTLGTIAHCSLLIRMLWFINGWYERKIDQGLHLPVDLSTCLTPGQSVFLWNISCPLTVGIFKMTFYTDNYTKPLVYPILKDNWNIPFLHDSISI